MKLIIEAVISLLVGISIFLLGMHMMSDGMKQVSGSNMKKLFNKISDNPIKGIGVGLAVTGVIQSSSVVTTMVVGFTNAGLMTLIQATAVIMGANIGTTVTGLLFASSTFKIGIYFPIFAIVGALFYFFSKKEVLNKIGYIILGLGLIFVGLSMMTGAINMIKDEDFFIAMFDVVHNPFLLIAIGLMITAVVHSSSTVNGIIITLVVPFGMTGGLDVTDAIFIMLGTNIGTCVTAIMASANANVNAKRAAMIHFLFNLIGTIIIGLPLMLISKENIAHMMSWFGNDIKFQIAWANLVFNLIVALILLPFIKTLVRIATNLVKSKSVNSDKKTFLDERFLTTPSFAIAQVLREIEAMSDLAKSNYTLSMEAILKQSVSNVELIKKNEVRIDEYNVDITNFLIKISGRSLLVSDKNTVARIFEVSSDFERIGAHAMNLIGFVQRLNQDNLTFSEEAIIELKVMHEKILDMYGLAVKVFITKDSVMLNRVKDIEDQVDDLEEKSRNNHILRLSEGKCVAENGMLFYGILNNLERIADHLFNVAKSVKAKKVYLKDEEASILN